MAFRRTMWFPATIAVIAVLIVVMSVVPDRHPSMNAAAPLLISSSVDTPVVSVTQYSEPTTAVVNPSTSTSALVTTTTVASWTIGNSGGFAIAPGQSLPSDKECAEKVTKAAETRPANRNANHQTGNANSATANNWGSSAEARRIMQRVSGKYTGTTDEIIQWASCKWGFDVDTVRAQVMVESGWRQAALAGWVPESTHCDAMSLKREAATTTSTTSTVPATSTTTVDVAVNDSQPSSSTATAPASNYECPTAFGLLQLRSDYQPGTYPLSARSTAYNLDYGLAMKRACYEGAGWLGPQTRGDAWGCVGAHYSGRWKDSGSTAYVAKVKKVLSSKSW